MVGSGRANRRSLGKDGPVRLRLGEELKLLLLHCMLLSFFVCHSALLHPLQLLIYFSKTLFSLTLFSKLRLFELEILTSLGSFFLYFFLIPILIALKLLLARRYVVPRKTR